MLPFTQQMMLMLSTHKHNAGLPRTSLLPVSLYSSSKNTDALTEYEYIYVAILPTERDSSLSIEYPTRPAFVSLYQSKSCSNRAIPHPPDSENKKEGRICVGRDPWIRLSIHLLICIPSAFLHYKGWRCPWTQLGNREDSFPHASI